MTSVWVVLTWQNSHTGRGIRESGVKPASLRSYRRDGRQGTHETALLQGAGDLTKRSSRTFQHGQVRRETSTVLLGLAAAALIRTDASSTPQG